MDKIKSCEYCSNCRTYEMTEEDEWDLSFCYDDEHDLSARSIFLSKDKQFDIMVVSGAGEPQRLEFRHWNKDAQRWFVYNTIYLKRCINCGRKITEYPEFIDERDKKIKELEQELAELKEKAIIPRFKIGQKVWYVGYSSVQSWIIKSIELKYIKDKLCEIYRLGHYGKDDYSCCIMPFDSDRYFATKQEALNKLKEMKRNG